MKKRQIILVIVILLIIGIVIWIAFQKTKILSGIESKLNSTSNSQLSPEISPAEGKEILFFSGQVSEINTQDNFLIIKPEKQEGTIKVVVGEDTKLTKISFSTTPNKDGSFSPIETQIKLSGFKVNDRVYVKAKRNIAGKTEIGIDDIEYIQIYP
jgi:hypothetical protein